MAKKIVQPVEVQATVSGDQSVKSFKAQIREAQQEALRLAAAFGETDERTLAAAKRVAELRDRMEDVNATIKGLHPDKFQAIANITGTLANGFAAAQGAAALLGGESEDLQKAMLRVQGAMAFAQGIAGLKDVQFQFAALKTMVVDGVKSMVAAIGATGFGAVLIAAGAAVTYLAMNWKEFTGQLTTAQKAAKAASDTMAEGAGNVEEQRLQIEYYRRVLNDTNKSESDRLWAFNQLKELVPTLTDNDISSANALAKVNAELDANVKNLVLKAQLDALIAKQAENNNKIAELNRKGLTEDVSLLQKAGNFIKAGFGLGPGAAMRFQMNNIQSGIKNTAEATAELSAENKALDDQMKELTSQITQSGTAVDKYTKQAEDAGKKTKEVTDYSIQRQIELTALEEDSLAKRQKLAGLNFDLSKEQLKEYGLTVQQISDLRNKAIQTATDEFNKEQLAKEKQHQADMLKAKEEAAAMKKRADESELTFIQAKYNEEELAAMKAAKTQEELTKSLNEIRLRELQNLIQSTRDAGNSTIELEKEIEQIRLDNAQKAADKQKDLRDKETEAEKQVVKARHDLRVAGAMATLELLDAITSNQDAKSEEQRKREFQRRKAFEIGNTIISTYSSAQQAYASQLAIATPDAPVRAQVAAAIAIVQGLARVATIQKQQYKSNTTAAGGGMSASRGNIPMPSMNSSSLGGGTQQAGQWSNKVYVTEGDISATQRRTRNLRKTSVL